MSSLQCWVKSASSVPTPLLFWNMNIFPHTCVKWNLKGNVSLWLILNFIPALTSLFYPCSDLAKKVYQSPPLEICLILVGLSACPGATCKCWVVASFAVSICGEMKCAVSTRWSVCGWLNRYRQRVCALWGWSLFTATNGFLRSKPILHVQTLTLCSRVAHSWCVWQSRLRVPPPKTCKNMGEGTIGEKKREKSLWFRKVLNWFIKGS